MDRPWMHTVLPPPPARVSVDAQVTVDIQGSSMDVYYTPTYHGVCGCPRIVHGCLLFYPPCQSIHGCPSNCGHPGIVHGCLLFYPPPPPPPPPPPLARVSVDAQVTVDIQGSPRQYSYKINIESKSDDRGEH